MNVKLKMKYERLLLIDAVVFFVYSIGALLFTQQMLDLHGVTLNEAGVFTAQIAGAAFFAFSTLNLIARRFDDPKVLHLVLDANLVRHVLSLIVCTTVVVSGGLEDNRSLSFVLLFLLFTVVYSVFYIRRRFIKREGRGSS